MAFSSLSAGQRLTVLLELLGGPQFATQMRAASAETKAFGANVSTAGRRTFIANQALYTLRRYAFFGTVAILGMSAAVVKLGATYLSSMQQARVALSPVIKNTAVLNGYLSHLFQIAKYSPFVIGDLTKAFSALYLSMNPIGIGGPQIIQTLQSTVNYLSVLQQLTPMAMRRVTNALGDLAYQGVLTGRMYNRLAQIGIPIGAILKKQMGLTGVSSSNVSQFNIGADQFLQAYNRYASTTAGISGAARRLSLLSFAGIRQVARDTFSQIFGHLISGAYGGPNQGLQGVFTRLLKPGGPLDKISSIQSPKGTLFAINRQLTGNAGLAKGLLLLITLFRNLGAVFLRVVIPAFVIGLHSLIIFWPALKILNYFLIEVSKHATLFKFVLGGLAAEFILVHTFALGAWLGVRLFSLVTFGSIPGLIKYLKFLKILRTIELVGLISRWKNYAFVLKAGGKAEAVWGANAYKNIGTFAKLSRVLFTTAGSVRAVGLAFLGWAGYIALAIFAMRKLNDYLDPKKKGITFGRSPLGYAAFGLAYLPGKLIGSKAHLTGRGSRSIPRTSAMKTVEPTSFGHGTLSLSSNDPQLPLVHTQVIIDRKVIAEAVERAKADKSARR